MPKRAPDMEQRIALVVARYREGIAPKSIAHEIGKDVSEVYRCLHNAGEPLRWGSSRKQRTLSMTWPDYRAQRCRFNNEIIFLGPYGANLLATLLIRGGHPLQRGSLVAAMWPDPDLEPDWAESSFRAHMRRLREVLPGVIAHASDGYYIKFPHREGERK